MGKKGGKIFLCQRFSLDKEVSIYKLCENSNKVLKSMSILSDYLKAKGGENG